MITCAHTADKPGYTLFPQHTIKIPSDSNINVIIYLSHSLHKSVPLSFLQGQKANMDLITSANWKGWRKGCDGCSFSDIQCHFFPPLFLLYLSKCMHRSLSNPWVLCHSHIWYALESHFNIHFTVHWNKSSPLLTTLTATQVKILVIKQHNLNSVIFSLYWPLMTMTVHWLMNDHVTTYSEWSRIVCNHHLSGTG